MLHIVTVVALLNPNRILPTEFILSKEMFICLKASSCNKSVAVPRSTNTLCTSKSLIHRVSTSASWCEVMTLEGLTGGKDIGLSIDWIALLLFGTWIVFTRAQVVAACNSLLFWLLD